jgi:hypothetical protein
MSDCTGYLWGPSPQYGSFRRNRRTRGRVIEISRVSDDQAAARLQRGKAGDGQAIEKLLAPVLEPAFRLAMRMLK